ncbi:unnamed protein product [Durusdinium trenchii]|uniref:Protein RFT1 homolog n=1 Tax=Durusdinium trenchii TaxID=1381693 RepID=A0ABP0JUJ8_9DINO
MVPVAVCWLLTGPVLRAIHKTPEDTRRCELLRAGAGHLLARSYRFLAVELLFQCAEDYATIGRVFHDRHALEPGGKPHLGLRPDRPQLDRLRLSCLPVGHDDRGVPSALYSLVHLLSHLALAQRMLAWMVMGLNITRDRVVQYVKMYLPAALSIGSDFWRRVSVIGTIASEVGPDDLAVFNASYRICWMALTFLGALAGGVGVQLNIALGKGSTADAKHAAWVGTMIAIVVLVVLGVLILCIPRSLARIFSNDPKVLDLFESCRWPFAAFAVPSPGPLR